MKVYYSKNKNALVYCGHATNSGHWDQHWKKDLTTNFVFNNFVVGETKKYLPKGSKIVEGGCGLGDKVWSLEKSGYDVLGIDFAEQTIDFLKNHTNLKVERGDITNIHAPDSSFDGYWSLGVIEHFIEGIDKPIDEMARIIKKHGFVFLTVPCMSSLRKLKARKNKYPQKEENFENFFQYIYPSDFIIHKFQEKGFSLIHQRGMDGVKGIKDELGMSSLKTLYNSRSLPARVVKKLINLTFSGYCGHLRFYVFKKN